MLTHMPACSCSTAMPVAIWGAEAWHLVLMCCRGSAHQAFPQAVLAKEAVYNAVGQSSFELHGHVDFTPWFRGPLVQAGSHLALV